MLAHEPLVQLLVPSLGAMIDKVPQAARASPTRRSASWPPSATATPRRPSEWMAKHIRDSAAVSRSRGIGLTAGASAAHRIRDKPTPMGGRRFVQTTHFAYAGPDSVRCVASRKLPHRRQHPPRRACRLARRPVLRAQRRRRRHLAVGTLPGRHRAPSRRTTSLVVMDLQTNEKKVIQRINPAMLGKKLDMHICHGVLENRRTAVVPRHRPTGRGRRYFARRVVEDRQARRPPVRHRSRRQQSGRRCSATIATRRSTAHSTSARS